MQYNITCREKDGGIQYIISYKDKHGKWRQRSKQGFDGVRVAKKAAQAAVVELRKELEQKKKLNVDYKDMTFKEFVETYLERMNLYREPETTRALTVAASAYSKLNDIKLTEIESEDIQQIVDAQTKKGLSPNTIHIYLSRISTMLKSAVDDYKAISYNPAENITLNEKTDADKKALSISEIKKMLEKFKGSKYYIVIFLAVHTGMRIGEILGLTWDNIDYNNNIITVNKQWKKNKKGIYSFGKLKSKNSYRDIPFPKKVEVELKKHSKIVSIDNRVAPFKSTVSTSIILNRQLKEHCGITLHELRHTYATHLVAGGLDFKTVAAILGHDVSQTIKTYSHIVDDMMVKAKNVIDNTINF